MKKQILINIIFFCLGIGLGILGMKLWYPTKPIKTDPTEEKIDSLKKEIIYKDSIREIYLKTIDTLMIEKERRVDSIRELPIDSAISYLQEKLRKYEN